MSCIFNFYIFSPGPLWISLLNEPRWQNKVYFTFTTPYSQNLLFHFNFLCLIYIAAPAPPRKTRGELYKDVDADYYGYRDEDDGVLVPLEQDVEKEGLSLTFGYWYSLNSSKMLLKFSVYFEADRLVVRTKKLSDQ